LDGRRFYSALDSEVPSDGVVTIDFQQGDNCGGSDLSPWWYNSYQCTDGKIDAQLVANALVFRKVGSSAAIDIRSTVKACKYGGDHCVSFIPPALDTGAAYELVLPKGSIYSPIAGPTRSDFTIKLFGPFPFDLPFSRTLSDLGARRWQIYLRHGLASDVACDATSCPALAAQLTLADSSSGANVAFELTRVSLSTVELYVPTATARQSFTLTVTGSAAITDGFGLPLRAGRCACHSRSDANAHVRRRQCL
jgi:hypothetical protein